MQHWKGWLCLPILVTFGLFAALIRGGGTLYWGPVDSDLTNQFYPWQVFIHRWLMRGVWPHWDPHVFSGYPTLETQQMLALNPVHLISLLLPANWGLPLQMGAHTVIAAAGMGWALHRWGRSSALAGALGAVVFAAGGLMAMRVAAGHFTVVAAIAWWPLAALSVLKITRATRPPTEGIRKISLWRRNWGIIRSVPSEVLTRRPLRLLLALSVIAHTMVFLAGGPQYIVYLFYIDLAILGAVHRRGTLFGGLTLLGSVWLLALIISAPQWLPAFWYLPYSARAGGSSGATGLDLTPMLNLMLEGILPYPFGDDVRFGHLHFKNAWETASYPGALAIVFSLAMLLRWLVWAGCRIGRRGSCRVALSPVGLAGVAVFAAGIYMAVGGWLPGFSGFRDVTKARAVMAFGVAIMSAVQLDALIKRGALVAKFCFLAALLTMGSLYMGWASGFGDDMSRFRELVDSFGSPFDKAGHHDYTIYAADAGPALGRFITSLRTAVVAGILLPAILFGVLVFFRGRKLTVAVVAPLLLLIVVLDLVMANGNKWMARHEWKRAELPPAVATVFGQKLEDTKHDFPWRAVLHPGIINKTHHMEGFYEYRGYDPLMPKRANNRMMVKGLLQLPQEEQRAFRQISMARAGVRYNAEEWMPGAADTVSSGIIELPRASLFEVTRAVTSEKLPEEIAGPDVRGIHYVMDGDEVIKLPEALTRHKQANDKGVPGQLRESETTTPLLTGRPDTFAIRVKLDDPALVIFKSTWLPGWRASIDGKDKGRALLANNWMSGVIVEAGEHDVVFQYRPVAWMASWILSSFGLLLTVMLVLNYRLFRMERNAVVAGEGTRPGVRST